MIVSGIPPQTVCHYLSVLHGLVLEERARRATPALSLALAAQHWRERGCPQIADFVLYLVDHAGATILTTVAVDGVDQQLSLGELSPSMGALDWLCHLANLLPMVHPSFVPVFEQIIGRVFDSQKESGSLDAIKNIFGL